MTYPDSSTVNAANSNRDQAIAIEVINHSRKVLLLLVAVFAPVCRSAAQTAAAKLRLDGSKAVAGIQTIEFGKNGLPEQITLRASRTELPLELRETKGKPGAMLLQWLGRGPRLRTPLRLQAFVKGKWVDGKVVTAAKATVDKGVVTARAKLQIGPYAVDLVCRYRAAGELQIDVNAAGGAGEDRLCLLLEPRGPVDLACGNLPDKPVGAVPRRELNPYLPRDEGVVWDSAEQAPDIRQLYVGSADAGFTWLGIRLPELADDASRIVITRDKLARVAWRSTLCCGNGGKASLALRLHPFRPRPDGARLQAWLKWPATLKALPGRTAGPMLLRSPASAAADGRRDFPGYLARASNATHAELRGNAGAAMLSREKDAVALYPMTLYQVLAGGPTGLVVRLRPNVRELRGRYEVGLDRQMLGRALLHDIGIDLRGLGQPAEFLRVTKALREFGFFSDDGKTEFIPYWRGSDLVRYGDRYDPTSAFNLTRENPAAGTWVSVYRRPFAKDKKTGVQVLFVVVNERDKPVRLRLSVLDAERIFGHGQRRPHGKEIMRKLDYGKVPQDSDWGVKAVLSRPAYSATGLLDLEMRGLVRAASNKGQTAEIYGPLHVPARDFRLLWTYSLPGRRRRR